MPFWLCGKENLKGTSKPSPTLGYVMGVGAGVPMALEQIGVKVVKASPTRL
jgi:hypothetical protein